MWKRYITVGLWFHKLLEQHGDCTLLTFQYLATGWRSNQVSLHLARGRLTSTVLLVYRSSRMKQMFNVLLQSNPCLQEVW